MKKILLLLLLPALAFAAQRNHVIPPDLLPYQPRFTGPYLAPTPINMEPGHPSIEPAIEFLFIYGQYNNHWKVERHPLIFGVNPQVDFQWAFTQNTGIEIFAGYISKSQNHKTASHFQDTVVNLGYQLLHDDKDSWTPNLRLIYSQIVPTGKYRRLSPDKVDIDFTGEGSYQFGPALAAQKLLYPNNRFLSLEASITYFFTLNTTVRDINVYGGTIGTHGRARPGHSLVLFFSGEYSFSQKYCFAWDLRFLHQRASHFSGDPGRLPDGTVPSTTLKPATQVAFAPEFEYNPSDKYGFLFGGVFSLFGRNIRASASAFAAFIYVF